jgi:putative ATP-grasp target RiPP
VTTNLTPWGMCRLAPYRNTLVLPYERVELDPDTQTTRYLDPTDTPVEMGKHGTSRATSSATSTGGDGGGPNPPAPADSDSIPDSESD